MAVDFLALARSARPANDADYATHRQIDAENAFFDHVERALGPMGFATLTRNVLHEKADADERVDLALQALGFRFWEIDSTRPK